LLALSNINLLDATNELSIRIKVSNTNIFLLLILYSFVLVIDERDKKEVV